MANLHEHLNGIAHKHGLASLDEAKPRPKTPEPTYATCVRCNNGPILLDAMCEPCYRTLHTKPLNQKLDKLIHEMSNINMSIVEHEAKLTNAKVAYNKAIKKNHACETCGQVFSFYGDLFAHEKARECKRTRTIGIRASQRTITDKDLI